MLFGVWFHQASAIHFQAATLTGIQTTKNRAKTGIGLVFSAFTVAEGGGDPTSPEWEISAGSNGTS